MIQIIRLLVNLISGSFLLISGVWLFSGALGGAFKSRLPKMLSAGGPVRIFWISTAVTALLQSSTAVSLLTVSFAESGLLSLTSSMAAIYGANLGTCVTAQIMSLDITEYGLYILGCGLILRLLGSAIKPFKALSTIIIAAGLLFTGLMTLNLSVPVIKNSPFIMDFIGKHGNSPLKLVLAGFILTALINSSSATVAITMTMFSGGILSLTQGVYVVFGDNIGTCVTALIAAQGAKEKGKQVALGHILYNSVGTAIVCIFSDAFIKAVIFFTNILNQPDSYLVANAHLLFNVLSALSFMPLNRQFCAMLEIICGKSRRRSQRV